MRRKKPRPRRRPIHFGATRASLVGHTPNELGNALFHSFPAAYDAWRACDVLGPESDETIRVRADAEARVQHVWDLWQLATNPSAEIADHVYRLAAFAAGTAQICARDHMARQTTSDAFFRRMVAATLRWAEIVWNRPSVHPGSDHLDVAYRACVVVELLIMKGGLEDRHRENAYLLTHQWALNAWSVHVEGRNVNFLCGAAAIAIEGLFQRMRANDDLPELREQIRSMIVDWAERAWALGDNPAVQRDHLLQVAPRAIDALRELGWQWTEKDTSRPVDLEGAWKWCLRGLSIGPEHGTQREWASLLGRAVTTAHDLSHATRGRPWPYHQHTIVLARRLWDVREGDWNWAAGFGVPDAMCALIELAQRPELSDHQDALFAETLAWAKRVREDSDCPDATLWIATGTFALDALLQWSRALAHGGSRRSGGPLAPDLRPLLAAVYEHGDAAARPRTPRSAAGEKLRMARDALVAMAATARNYQTPTPLVRSDRLAQASAGVVARWMLGHGPRSATPVLDDALAVCRWAGAEVAFWKAVPLQINNELALLPFWERPSRMTTLAGSSAEADDPRMAWLVALSRVLLQGLLVRHDASLSETDERVPPVTLGPTISRVGRVLNLAFRWLPSVMGGVADEELRSLRACFATLALDDARPYSLSGLQDSVRAIIDHNWRALPEPRERIAEQIFELLAMSDLHGRLRTTKEDDVARDLPTGPTLLARARQIAQREARTFVQYFDTGRRLLRTVVSPSGNCAVIELERHAVVVAYERFCSLADDLAASLRDVRRPWLRDEELMACISSLASLLLGDLPVGRITVLPHGFLHDALSAAAQRWCDEREHAVLEQASSLANYLALRERWQALSTHRVRTQVLIVAAGDIALYRDRISGIVGRFAGPHCDVFRYRLEKMSGTHGETLDPRTRLERWGADGRWKTCKADRMDPDVCVWLLHGHHNPEASDPIRNAMFSLIASTKTEGLRVLVDTLGGRRSVTLPIVEDVHQTSRRLIINRDVAGLQIGFDRCRLVLAGACSTGRVARELSEDLPGLLRGFFLAGIPAVVAASWSVPTPLPPPGRLGVAEILWRTLLQELVAPASEGRTIASAVRRARAAARGVRESQVAEWGHLALHGYGDVASPLTPSGTR